MKNKKILKIALVITITIFIAAFNISCIPNYLIQNENEQATETKKEETSSGEISVKQEYEQFTLGQFNSKINGLVKSVTPSVVSIQVGVITENLVGQEQLQQGMGSGVILNKEGYILTNSHVVGNAEKLIVTLNNGVRKEATLVGINTETDIGVIKIDADNLQPADFGTIEDEEVGDIVIAVGSPFGIQQTVTMGIISGKGRVIPIASDQLPIVDAIQTDAAINPGNSGGPLINIGGKVIGINTLGISTSGTSSGVGFAIPVDTAVNIAEQIIKYGRARIPFMGIEIGQNNTDIAGALIANVLEGSPADKAGLKPEDIIVEFDEKEIKTPYEILSQLLRKDCGQVVQLKVYRNGDYIDINLELEECPPRK